MTDAAIKPAFPSFYAECAFNDGAHDARQGHDKSRASFLRHGEIEPVGMKWYQAGRASVLDAAGR